MWQIKVQCVTVSHLQGCTFIAVLSSHAAGGINLAPEAVADHPVADIFLAGPQFGKLGELGRHRTCRLFDSMHPLGVSNHPTEQRCND